MSSHRMCRICLDIKCADLVTFKVVDTEWASLYEFCVGVSLASKSCSQQSCAFGRNCGDELYDFAEFKKKCLKNYAAWRQMCSEENNIDEDKKMQIKQDIEEEVYAQESCSEQINKVSHHTDPLEESSLHTENPVQDATENNFAVGCKVKHESECDNDSGNTINTVNTSISPQAGNDYVKTEEDIENAGNELEDDMYEKGDIIIIPKKFQVASAELTASKLEDKIIEIDKDVNGIYSKISKPDNNSRRRKQVIICRSYETIGKDNDQNNISTNRNKPNIISRKRVKVIFPTKNKVFSTKYVENKPDDETTEKNNENVCRKTEENSLIEAKYADSECKDDTIGKNYETNHISRNINKTEHISRRGRKVIIPKKYKLCSTDYSDSAEDEDSPITKSPKADPDYCPGSEEEDDIEYLPDTEVHHLKEILELRGDTPRVKKPQVAKPRVKKVQLPPASFLYCGICEYQCSHMKDLRIHWNLHVAKNDLNCKLCDYIGRDFADMAAHRIKHQSLEFAHKLACIKCHRENKDPHMEFHYRSVHLRKKGGWCRVCGKEISVYLTFMDHQAGHEAPYICDCCGRKYSRSGITRHLLPKKYVCDQCGNGYTTATLLKYHRDSHSTAYTMKCDHCDKSFRSERHLQFHKNRMKQHNICEICGAVFKAKHNLKSHQRRHNDAMPFSCSICGKGFKWKANMQAHELRHEKGMKKGKPKS